MYCSLSLWWNCLIISGTSSFIQANKRKDSPSQGFVMPRVARRTELLWDLQAMWLWNWICRPKLFNGCPCKGWYASGRNQWWKGKARFCLWVCSDLSEASLFYLYGASGKKNWCKIVKLLLCSESRCAYDQQGQLLSSPAKTDGILGLSSAAISLPSQLASHGIISNIFGHCITREQGGGGYMFLGDDYAPRWGMTWTSIRSGPE